MALVRSSDRRLRKWDLKYSGDAIPPKLIPYKTDMKEQLAEHFQKLESLESDVKTILADHMVGILQNPWYLNFAREIYRLRNRFSGPPLQKEIEIAMNKWYARGLDKDIMERIMNTQFTVVLPPPAQPVP